MVPLGTPNSAAISLFVASSLILLIRERTDSSRLRVVFRDSSQVDRRLLSSGAEASFAASTTLR
jgi:hypothetical protein